MKRTLLIRLLAAALVAGSALALSGCSSSHEQQESTQLPWARPASWEGGMPGGFGQQGRGSAF